MVFKPKSQQSFGIIKAKASNDANKKLSLLTTKRLIKRESTVVAQVFGGGRNLFWFSEAVRVWLGRR